MHVLQEDYPQERKGIVSTFEAANNIRQCAEAKGDEDMLRLLLGVSYDLGLSINFLLVAYLAFSEFYLVIYLFFFSSKGSFGGHLEPT